MIAASAPVETKKLVIRCDEPGDPLRDHQLSTIPHPHIFRPKSERPQDGAYRRPGTGRISAADFAQSQPLGSFVHPRVQTSPSQVNCRSPTEIPFHSMEHNQSHLTQYQ